jgi:hypothetical protein
MVRSIDRLDQKKIIKQQLTGSTILAHFLQTQVT